MGRYEQAESFQLNPVLDTQPTIAVLLLVYYFLKHITGHAKSMSLAGRGRRCNTSRVEDIEEMVD